MKLPPPPAHDPMALPQNANAANALSLYVITTKTKTFGEKFVVREHKWQGQRHFEVAVPTAVVDTVEQARVAVTKAGGRGLVQLERFRKDAEIVVESWGTPLVVRFLTHLGRTQ